MIVFLSCTKQKKNCKCIASQMYSASLWFRGAYEYAKSMSPDKIYILSAKYGLLEETDIIEPYEKSLITAKNEEIKKWSRMVIKQLQSKGIKRKSSFSLWK